MSYTHVTVVSKSFRDFWLEREEEVTKPLQVFVVDEAALVTCVPFEVAAVGMSSPTAAELGPPQRPVVASVIAYAHLPRSASIPVSPLP